MSETPDARAVSQAERSAESSGPSPVPAIIFAEQGGDGEVLQILGLDAEVLHPLRELGLEVVRDRR